MLVRGLFSLGIVTLAAFPVGVGVAGLVLGIEAVPELLRYIAIFAAILCLGPLVDWAVDNRPWRRWSCGPSGPARAGPRPERTDQNAVGMAQLGRLRELENALGPDHPQVMVSQDLFVAYLYLTGRVMEALVAARLYAEIRSRALGPSHPNTLRARRLIIAMASNDTQTLRRVLNDLR